MKINWNALTPACWAIGTMNKCDLQVAEGYMQQNIREGRDMWMGAVELPREHRPIWAELGGQDALVENNDGFNAWRKARHENYARLSALFRAGKYTEMVTLMDGANPEG